MLIQPQRSVKLAICTATLWLVTFLGAAGVAAGQPVPQPFPRPGAPPNEPTLPSSAGRETSQPPPAQTPTSVVDAEAPSEATLGVQVYPGAQFLASYDAGRGQQFYLFGTNSSFEDMITYYRTILRDSGDRVFDAPGTHMFDVGRFRKETMAFPPGVTIKDYTWNGSEGFLNPRPDSGPERFKTVIQIVPPPPAAR